jgi:hypothetical protein
MSGVVAWFSGTREPAGGAPPAGHRSLALKELLDALRPGTRHSVLDLGPSVAANVRFLVALSCRVRIADLVRSMAAEPVESRRPEAVPALLERLLPMAPDEKFDAVLAWDVFDYMRPDQVACLADRLAKACRPEAPLLLFVSTRRTIPATPLRYRIVNRENVAHDGPLEPSRPCPRYGQHDIQRLLPAFSVRRSFLLRSGIQEFLLAPEQGVRAQAGAVAAARTWRPWLRRGPL